MQYYHKIRIILYIIVFWLEIEWYKFTNNFRFIFNMTTIFLNIYFLYRRREIRLCTDISPWFACRTNLPNFSFAVQLVRYQISDTNREAEIWYRTNLSTIAQFGKLVRFAKHGDRIPNRYQCTNGFPCIYIYLYMCIYIFIYIYIYI